ncbi:unnamed protein product [Parnassius apollo]|uniref:(apollo) hypothetical protein n=1 Tax=Parnassius apollo TaxID=110799 RepID=A0A8S3Y1M0_PARAO|nr:unnamed protein product [Parnassius apollo]
MESFDYESGPIGLPHISTEEYRSINQGNIAQNNEINEKTAAVNTPVDIANDSVVSFVQTSLTHGKTDSTSEGSKRVVAPTAVSTGSETNDAATATPVHHSGTAVSMSDSKLVIAAAAVTAKGERKLIADVVRHGNWKPEKSKED